MSDDWLPIRYRDFHDIPRAIVVDYGGDTYFLDCPFNEELDAYPDVFTVYRLPRDPAGRIEDPDWADLPRVGVRIGLISARDIDFDPSRRALINAAVFDGLGVG